jgi:nucleotide-binding universal stress UspA family protein
VTWARILAPLAGGAGDAGALAAARALAEPFAAALHAAYCAPPPERLFTWVNESGPGPGDLAIGELGRITACGEASVRSYMAKLRYPKARFENLTSQDWCALRTAARFADVVVWGREPACGHGVFASPFRRILLEERRPAFVADTPPKTDGLTVIAWDGGQSAANAVRSALPWLARAACVVVLTAPHANAHPCGPDRILAFLAEHGIAAKSLAIHGRGDVGFLLVDTARRMGATTLVAGAYGQDPIRRFIFGGVTRTLLDAAPGIGLFLSH